MKYEIDDLIMFDPRFLNTSDWGIVVDIVDHRIKIQWDDENYSFYTPQQLDPIVVRIPSGTKP